MFGFNKSSARREAISKNRPDAGVTVMSRLRAEGGLVSIGVAAVFCLLAVVILVMREDVVRYRPGQWTHHDVVARVQFSYHDDKTVSTARELARASAARVYKPADEDPWKAAEDELIALPDRVKDKTFAELPADLKVIFDEGTLSKLQDYQTDPNRSNYEKWVHQYIAAIRAANWIIIPDAQRQEDHDRFINVTGIAPSVRVETTFSPKMFDDIDHQIDGLAETKQFPLTLRPKIEALTLKHLGPTYVLDDAATAAARNTAADNVPASVGDIVYEANKRVADIGEISQEEYQLLKAENAAYLHSLGMARWGERGGLAGIVVLMTIVVCAYISRYQPRIVRNHARAIAIGVLMLAMLLLAQLAALGTNTIFFFGIAPTILVAMILAIAYDQRFALGMATFHAVLVTMALDADISFLAILEAGVFTCCFLMDNLRTRSRLIEVGGATAVAMVFATAASGFIQFDPVQYVARNCLYAAAAGLAVGFVVLGILPFIEKMFRITTSMTLLELADASHPLLRRLSLEAPGTYAHSQQVATLADDAAEAIGGNSLLCRVAAYYHDVGKINKAEYFVENQIAGQNRHINLSPSVSLLIIIGHVKDGIELAREYNLPTSIFPFIQQHHGTTLVEFFYHRACDQSRPQETDVSETQYRYPGPKPKTKEIAILMLADAVESACRSMTEPTASRIETLVHELALRRLLDGQFAECDLTMRELELVERSLTKTLLGIYHGRIAYPSTAAIATGEAVPTTTPAAKTA